MAMTGAMQDILYNNKNFNFDFKEHRHPLWTTEGYYFYHLTKDQNGGLAYSRTTGGQLIRSPRYLSGICSYNLVRDVSTLRRVTGKSLPSNYYPTLLTEAVFQREGQAIISLVSTWPMTWLRLYDILPLEDYLENDYLTHTFDENENVCLLDYIILGLLTLHPESFLQVVDFSLLEKDRKLCKEICRLPILWMKPEERNVETIHEYLQDTLEISKDKVQRYLNKLQAIYFDVFADYKHGNDMDIITILIDLKVTMDDVLIGLTLQSHTPFRFVCSKLWMQPITDVSLAPDTISKLLDANQITHFEFEDRSVSVDDERLQSLLSALEQMRHLEALSLPSSVDVTNNQSMANIMNKTLIKLGHLKRLNFSYCNLRGQLGNLLAGINQTIIYLDIRDCRLAEDDIYFLVNWKPVASVLELNLSHNYLKHLDHMVFLLLEKMSYITCFSISYCSFEAESQIQVAQRCKECSHLKVLCMQSFTPLPKHHLHDVLYYCGQNLSLQKCVILPGFYAFIGGNDAARRLNKMRLVRYCYKYLQSKSRADIMLE